VGALFRRGAWARCFAAAHGRAVSPRRMGALFSRGAWARCLAAAAYGRDY
jgi:hypothetical protein